MLTVAVTNEMVWGTLHSIRDPWCPFSNLLRCLGLFNSIYSLYYHLSGLRATRSCHDKASLVKARPSITNLMVYHFNSNASRSIYQIHKPPTPFYPTEQPSFITHPAGLEFSDPRGTQAVLLP